MYNTSVGYDAGRSSDGSNNASFGTAAGKNADGDNNIYLGTNAGAYRDGDNNIEIVTDGFWTSILGDVSNKIHIENTIVGDTDARRLAIGLVGTGDLSPDATLEIKPSGTATVGMIVQGAVSHTANLTEWQNSSETVLASVAADGATSVSGLITAATGIALQRNTPATTTDKLYNVAGALYFDGSAVGGSSYTAGTGLTLVGTEFNTANTGRFADVEIDDRLVFDAAGGVWRGICSIGAGTPSASDSNYNLGSIYIGTNAGQTNTWNSSAVYIGTNAGGYSVGTLNVCIGNMAGYYMGASAVRSIVLGNLAAVNLEGADNICIGNTAGRTADGDLNIFIGKQAGKLSVGDQNIEIVTDGPTTSILNGYSKKIHIANTIVGDAVTQRLAIGSVGSGDLSPDATLEIKPSGTATVGMIVQAEASHTANLTEWQDSSETVLASVAADGATSVSGLLTAATGIALQRNTPAVTTDKLYNVGGDLYFDGSAVGGSSYTAGTGLTLVGTEFNTANTGNFDQVTFTDHQIKIGSGIGDIGTRGIAIGKEAGKGTIGNAQDSVSIGTEAGQNCDGDYNVFVGRYAGKSMSDSSSSAICIGPQAGRDAGSATSTVNIGVYAGYGSNGGNWIGLGTSAGYASYGDKNIFMGYQAGSNCAGDNNIEIVTNGAATSILDDLSNKIHIENTIVGDTSAKKLAIGNVGVGDVVPDATLEVKPSATTDVGLIVQGASSHTANLTEWQDSSETVLASVAADGATSVSGLITAATGIALQRNTPAVTTDKLYNVAGALYFDGSEVGGGGSSYTAGTGLTLVGTEFNTANTGVFDEVATSGDLLIGNKTAGVGTGYMDHLIFNRNLGIGQACAIGVGAGTNIGQHSICIGNAAGSSVTDGNATSAIYIGASAGQSNQGDGNIAIGGSAGQNMGASETYNVAVGFAAAQDGGGNENVCLGYGAGSQADGDNNIYLGKWAGSQSAGDANIDITTDSKYWPSILGDASNKIHIENTIIGDTDTRRLAIGNIGTGDLSPDATLEIKPSGTATVGMIVQAAVSQTANLTEWQDSSETVLAYVDKDGSLSGNDMTLAGHLAATTKSFLIDHPTKEGKKLQYASLEGPEHGVYVRGYTDVNTITLPDYWTELVHNDSLTVHLTPKDFAQPNLFVSGIIDNKIYLNSDGQKISTYYTINGTRKDVDPLEIEPEG